MHTDLPHGWTIERVRSASGDAAAELLPLERLVVLEEHGAADYEVLAPDVILSFHGLCLARAAGEWFMGELDGDGSLVCWSSYGPDLGEAVRAL
ncbi:hypothetical protein ACFYUY_26455 [Kitasatospora sp. NPDC004745]|uniref:hypothetical protein n=1 Tax=unclassified Kitasatospora TaxID=2633591 RepID=UPI0033F87B53